MSTYYDRCMTQANYMCDLLDTDLHTYHYTFCEREGGDRVSVTFYRDAPSTDDASNGHGLRLSASTWMELEGVIEAARLGATFAIEENHE